MDVEVAVKIIEEDLGRRAGGREVAAGAEARGEAVEAREEGVHGERDRGVGDERVVLGGDAERGAGEVRAAADGDAAPRAHPGEPPHLRHEPVPRPWRARWPPRRRRRSRAAPAAAGPPPPPRRRRPPAPRPPRGA